MGEKATEVQLKVNFVVTLPLRFMKFIKIIEKGWFMLLLWVGKVWGEHNMKDTHFNKN